MFDKNDEQKVTFLKEVESYFEGVSRGFSATHVPISVVYISIKSLTGSRWTKILSDAGTGLSSHLIRFNPITPVYIL
jgi:hypothetical protein